MKSAALLVTALATASLVSSGCLFPSGEVVLPKELHILLRIEPSSTDREASFPSAHFEFEIVDANETVVYEDNGTARYPIPRHDHLTLLTLDKLTIRGEATVTDPDARVPIGGSIVPGLCPSAPEAHLVIKLEGFAYGSERNSMTSHVEFRCSEHWSTSTTIPE